MSRARPSPPSARPSAPPSGAPWSPSPVPTSPGPAPSCSAPRPPPATRSSRPPRSPPPRRPTWPGHRRHHCQHPERVHRHQRRPTSSPSTHCRSSPASARWPACPPGQSRSPSPVPTSPGPAPSCSAPRPPPPTRCSRPLRSPPPRRPTWPGHRRHHRQTPGGTNATSPADQFIYETGARRHCHRPAAGPLVGGTSVTITGTDLGAASAVKFGSALAAITASSATSVTGHGAVRGGRHRRRHHHHPERDEHRLDRRPVRLCPVPTVSAVSPLAGPPAGGTALAVTGTDFNAATAVMFGTTPPPPTWSRRPPTWPSPRRPGRAWSTSSSPPPGGQAPPRPPTGSPMWRPRPSPPSARRPARSTGGTTVTITGTGSAASPRSSSAPPPPPTPWSRPRRSPPRRRPSHRHGRRHRHHAGGPSATSAADQFSYAPAPVITSANPVSGPLAGAAQVTITGTCFAGATAVDFGATAATITASSATSITATAPADLAGGTVDITVTTPSGTSATSSADQYTYEGVPVVTTVSPVAGVPAGGSRARHHRTGFTGATAVDFGTTPAVYSVVPPPRSPPPPRPTRTGHGRHHRDHAVGHERHVLGGPVHLRGHTRQSPPSARSPPRWRAAPRSPSPGPASPRPRRSSFGAGAAAYTVVSSTSITATSPAETAGTVDVTVTTPGGTSTTSSADHFTYEAVPSGDRRQPGGRPARAGQHRQYHAGPASPAPAPLDFGSAVTTSYSVVSSTSITASAPADPAGAPSTSP